MHWLFHRRCLPPLEYPLSYIFESVSNGDTAAYVRFGWPIEFTDCDAIRKEAEGTGEPLEVAVGHWLDRREKKAAQIYRMRAEQAFKKLGML